MKKVYIFLLLPIILFLLTGCENNDNNQMARRTGTDTADATNTANNPSNTNTNTNTNIQRITVPIDNADSTTNNISNINTTNSIANTSSNDNATSNNSETNIAPTNTNTEVELSSFSTEILTSDSNRNNNIHLTCETLNEHVVKSGETFSFTELIGKSTSDKGYKEANVIAADGDTIKGLGGGNCQVSSTLYNAVAKIPELEVLERHNHGHEVYYIPLGQDAAVAYGSMDFKFKNNLGNDIKIFASTDDKNVTVRIVKI